MEPTLADLESGVRALEHSPKLQQSLASILKSAKGDVEGFIRGLQGWFDRQMDRVTGSYKRWAKRWVIFIAIVVVCACNLDSIAIARALDTSGAVRAAVVQQASDQNFCSAPDDQARCAVEARNVLESIGIPLGWSAPNPQDGIWGWLAPQGAGPTVLDRRSDPRRPVLVPGPRPGRDASQYGTSAQPWFIARLGGCTGLA